MNSVKSFVIILLLLMLNGCQSSNSESTTGTDDSNKSTVDINTSATTDIKALTIAGGSSITVTGSGQTKEIYINAFNANNTTNTAGTVAVQYPNKYVVDGIDVGSFSPGVATVENGVIHFTYTAPSDLKARVDNNDTYSEFTFFSTTDATAKTTLRVNYAPTNDIVSTPAVLNRLILSQNAITTTKSAESFTVNLFAYTDQNTSDINSTVLIRYDGTSISSAKDVGEIASKINVENGRATFQYTAPQNLYDTSASLASTTFTLYDQNNPAVSTTLTITFSPALPTLSVENQTLTLTQDAQQKTINVLAFNSSSQAFDGGTVAVVYPTAISNGTVSGGLFAANEVAIENGKAVFEYTGPTPLVSMVDQIFTFKFKEDSSVATTSMTVQYKPDQPTISSLVI
ncbi:MAG: hypothetical protein IE880_06025, partial [Epsilonproteobacteria bacterium]|nr:hypothetical protein [Campylobacterota bacterium]